MRMRTTTTSLGFVAKHGPPGLVDRVLAVHAGSRRFEDQETLKNFQRIKIKYLPMIPSFLTKKMNAHNICICLFCL